MCFFSRKTKKAFSILNIKILKALWAEKEGFEPPEV